MIYVITVTNLLATIKTLTHLAVILGLYVAKRMSTTIAERKSAPIVMIRCDSIRIGLLPSVPLCSYLLAIHRVPHFFALSKSFFIDKAILLIIDFAFLFNYCHTILAPPLQLSVTIFFVTEVLLGCREHSPARAVTGLSNATRHTNLACLRFVVYANWVNLNLTLTPLARLARPVRPQCHATFPAYPSVLAGLSVSEALTVEGFLNTPHAVVEGHTFPLIRST